jgi:hypothetical protein
MMLHVFIVLAILLIFEVPHLIKSRQYKSLVIYSVIYVITFTLAVCIDMGVKLPSSFILLGELFKKIGLTY